MAPSQDAQSIRNSPLQLHFADEEGDPWSVELAARLGGYVVGSDSDFVVLNADGYKGYVPIAEMVWSTLASDEESLNGVESDGGFQTVTSKSKRKAQRQPSGVLEGLIPPSGETGLQLSVTVYTPTSLAEYLKIPVSLLPLLGALVGNDFTGVQETALTTSRTTNLHWLFFEKQLTQSQRIVRVANTLRSILDAALTAPAKGKQKIQVNSVMQLIDRAVTTLTVRSADVLSSGERERVVERIVDATLQYAIPKSEAGSGPASLWSSPLCALHSGEACPLVRCLSKPLTSDVSDSGSEVASDHTLRDSYIAAYRTGNLDSRLLDIMNTGTFWYRQFLENPDYESVGKSIARPINEIIYALLDEVFALPVGGDEESEVSEDEDDEDDDDELIDVVEESDDEDPLAPLRGALQQLDDSVDYVVPEPATPSSTPPTLLTKRKVLMEYIRRGTRLAPEEVAIPSLTDTYILYGISMSTVPIQLRSEDDRFVFFLRILRSDVAPVRALPAQMLFTALALRWTASTLDLRARQSNGSKERTKERWTKHEARAFLAAWSGNQDLLDRKPFFQS